MKKTQLIKIKQELILFSFLIVQALKSLVDQARGPGVPYPPFWTKGEAHRGKVPKTVKGPKNLRAPLHPHISLHLDPPQGQGAKNRERTKKFKSTLASPHPHISLHLDPPQGQGAKNRERAKKFKCTLASPHIATSGFASTGGSLRARHHANWPAVNEI